MNCFEIKCPDLNEHVLYRLWVRLKELPDRYENTTAVFSSFRQMSTIQGNSLMYMHWHQIGTIRSEMVI